jgi:hypothetical protein
MLSNVAVVVLDPFEPFVLGDRPGGLLAGLFQPPSWSICVGIAG